MLVSLESGGTGSIGFGVIVQAINGNVITLSENVDTSGTSDVKFAGAPYTDGVVTESNNIIFTDLKYFFVSGLLSFEENFPAPIDITK